jgi:hypothetical protein
MSVPDDWIPRLASAIAGALKEFGASVLRGEPVAAFDIGCFPWHGSVELSILTGAALDVDPVLAEPGEQAAWPQYNFAIGLAAWEPAAELGHRMADVYQGTGEADRPAVVEAYLRACASAVACPQVQAALGELRRDPRFWVSVAHPDDGRQFWPPG